jgi:hypothetical protein
MGPESVWSGDPAELADSVKKFEPKTAINEPPADTATPVTGQVVDAPTGFARPQGESDAPGTVLAEPGGKELNPGPEDDFVKSVVDVAISGKFPQGLSLKGERLAEEGIWSQDFETYDKLGFVASPGSPMLETIHNMVYDLQDGSNAPFANKHFLIDIPYHPTARQLQVHPQLTQYKEGYDILIFSAQQPKNLQDRTHRHVRAANVYFLVPTQQADEFMKLVREDPDGANIADRFLKKAAPDAIGTTGRGIQRVDSSELMILDKPFIRSFAQREMFQEDPVGRGQFAAVKALRANLDHIPRKSYTPESSSSVTAGAASGAAESVVPRVEDTASSPTVEPVRTKEDDIKDRLNEVLTELGNIRPGNLIAGGDILEYLRGKYAAEVQQHQSEGGSALIDFLTAQRNAVTAEIADLITQGNLSVSEMGAKLEGIFTPTVVAEISGKIESRYRVNPDQRVVNLSTQWTEFRHRQHQRMQDPKIPPLSADSAPPPTDSSSGNSGIGTLAPEGTQAREVDNPELYEKYKAAKKAELDQVIKRFQELDRLDDQTSDKAQRDQIDKEAMELYKRFPQLAFEARLSIDEISKLEFFQPNPINSMESAPSSQKEIRDKIIQFTYDQIKDGNPPVVENFEGRSNFTFDEDTVYLSEITTEFKQKIEEGVNSYIQGNEEILTKFQEGLGKIEDEDKRRTEAEMKLLGLYDNIHTFYKESREIGAVFGNDQSVLRSSIEGALIFNHLPFLDHGDGMSQPYLDKAHLFMVQRFLPGIIASGDVDPDSREIQLLGAMCTDEDFEKISEATADLMETGVGGTK